MIPKDQALALYRRILLIRKCEEAIRRDYGTNEIKTPVHLCNGSEAIAAGVIGTLPPRSKFFGSYRNHGIYLTLTDDTDGFFGELYGKETGCAQGKAGSMHLTAPEKGLFFTSAVVGTTIPVAVGVSFANQYRQNNDYVAAFFGDGAMEEGVFWESFNFACLHKLRILFVCENNDLAIHALGHERKGFQSFEDAVRGFDCHAMGGEGYDVRTVVELTRSLVQKMEKDPKPGFVRFDYFRYLEHVGIGEDFHAGYRKKPDEAALKNFDPLTHGAEMVLELGVKQAELTALEESLDEKIKKSITRAKKAPFPPSRSLFDHVVV